MDNFQSTTADIMQTSVGVHPYATFRSPMNFKNPDDFVPERWLHDPKYSEDDLFASQPFGYGPKMCPGKVRCSVHTADRRKHLLYIRSTESRTCRGTCCDDSPHLAF